MVGNVFCDESDTRIAELRRWLDDFYSSTTSYQSFEAPTPKPEFWEPIAEDIRRRVTSGRDCGVLEWGAGPGRCFTSSWDLRARRLRFEAQEDVAAPRTGTTLPEPPIACISAIFFR